MDACVYDLQPAYIFINIGTNDLNGADYSKDELIGRYAQILQGIKEHLPEAKIIMMAYYPVNPSVSDAQAEVLKYRTNARISEANAAVQELAGKVGARFLDLNRPLLDENNELRAEYTSEGMHLSVAGYKAVFDELVPVLSELF